MPKVTTTLLGVTQAGKDGLREWRYVVNGLDRTFYTVKAPNATEAKIALESRLGGVPPQALPSTLLGGEDDEKSTGSNVVALGLLSAAAYGIYKLVQWWRRDEDGPTDGWGVGFGKGNAGLNLNPFDKGKAGTGDGGEDPGAKWERTIVAGVKGWRRKGIPLPGEEGNPNTFQAAVLIVSDGPIPDVSKWPNTLPVFFVNDSAASYPEVDGGWLVDARFGTLELQRKYPTMIRNFACAATDSASLTKCLKRELEDTLSIQWA
ncbi:MAG TPA: hypothetical protein DCQ04_12310 [Actinobacteria bacterium]|nr:hypothetical protein [Actinomycetota bacterium]